MVWVRILCSVAVCFFLGCVWEETDSASNYLPLDDSEYPYAGLPRLVVETNDFAEVRNTETVIPAKIQIYGEKAPETQVIPAFVEGRGNMTFEDMPKYGIKIISEEKAKLLGLPWNKEWVLLPDYSDKTKLRDYISFKLSEWVGLSYTPRSEYVEMFLNRQYMGVFLLAEKIKVGKRQVNLPDENNCYLVEIDKKYKPKDQVIISGMKVPFRILYPKNASEDRIDCLRQHLDSLENFLTAGFDSLEEIKRWFDLSSYLKFYWIQEFAKNHDAAFKTSVYFSWCKGGTIKMGPVWDFDIAYGGLFQPFYSSWYIRNHYWNEYLFKNAEFKKAAKKYWVENQDIFQRAIDSLDLYQMYLQDAADNEYKRWPVLNSTEYRGHLQAYDSYFESVDSLQSWMENRREWINKHL